MLVDRQETSAEGRRVTEELAEALDQALKFRGHIDWGTRRLLKTILHEESLAQDFVSKRCQMDTLFELLSRAQDLP